MPQPAPSDLYVNVPLTNISIAYMQDESNFIADRVFPNIPVERQSGMYFQYNREDWLRADAQERGPGAESAGSGFNVSLSPPFYCRVWALHKDVDDQTRANTMRPLDLDRDSAQWLGNQMLLRKEQQFVTNYFGPGIWTTNLTGTAGAPGAGQVLQWDQANSTPIQDIRKQKLAIGRSTAFRPNKLVIGPEAWNVLVDHPTILDRIKYTQRAITTEDILAQVLQVDEVLVPAAVMDTSNEGNAAPAYAFDYGKDALLVYAAPAPSLMKPSGGYTFSWSGYLGAGALGTRTKRFRMEHLASDRIESEMAFDMHVVGPDLGVFLSQVVA